VAGKEIAGKEIAGKEIDGRNWMEGSRSIRKVA
jgi:hypothetical protein